MSTSKHSFDIIIGGSGHVGSCLAAALVQLGYRTAFVDAIPQEQRKNKNDNRVFALSHSSRDILEKLNVWPLLSPHVTPIQHIHVSNRGTFGAARLHAKDLHYEALGYMVSSHTLQNILNQAIERVLSTEKTLTLFSPASIQNFSVHSDRVDVTINGEVFSTQWLIGVDGKNSFIRQYAGISFTEKDYQQKALVSLIDLQNSHQFTAYERFVGDTAIALLPHTPWQSVLIWSGDNAFIDTIMSCDDRSFLYELQRAFGYRLGKFSGLSERYAYPLTQKKADTIYKGRLLLMGDAAQTLHPMGAQGFNLALRNVARFTHILNKSIIHSSPALTQEHLETYVKEQEKDTVNTIRFTDRLVKFSSQSSYLNSATRALMINLLGSSQLAQHYLLK